MKRFWKDTLSELPYNDIMTKMFSCGFYDSHIKYLHQLLSLFDNNSMEIIKIQLNVLNVIALIISDRKFVIKNALNKIKSQSLLTSSSSLDNNNASNLDLTQSSSQINLASNVKLDIDNNILSIHKSNSNTNFQNVLNENGELVHKNAVFMDYLAC